MMVSSPRLGQPTPGKGEPPDHGVLALDEQATGEMQETSLAEQFEVLYATFYPRILRYLYHLLGDRAQAEDAAQDTFLKAWQHLGGLRPNSHVSSWLYRIARNTARDLLRHRAHIAWQGLQGLDVEDDDHEQERVEAALLLQRAFDLLAPQHKRVLAVWNGERPLAQVAAILQTTEGTARNRLSRARLAWRHSYAALLPEDRE